MRIKIRKRQNCYIAKNLKDMSKILAILKSKNATYSKLFFKNKHYYILSDKEVDITGKITSNFLTGYLEEYATLISENAIKEVLKLL